MAARLFEAIKIAHRARLLFHTDSEFREYMGVSFDTIAENKDDESEIDRYYTILNRECFRQTDRSLLSITSYYLKASNVFRGIDFEWMERKQLASRKKFCRWLFRLSATPGIKLNIDDEFQFKPKDCDEELKKEFYPDGIENGRTIDLIFIMLMTFGIIKPIADIDKGRSRDITAEDVMKSLKEMLNLLKILDKDIPSIGVTGKPLMYAETISLLQSLAESDMTKESIGEYTIAWFWNILDTLESVCITTSSPHAAAETYVIPVGYRMNGIWIDDNDKGKTRFWIFPENKLMAFCYVYDKTEWILNPFEFCFYATEYDNDVDDICVFVSPKGNLQILSHAEGLAQRNEISTLNYEKGAEDQNGEFTEIRFYSTIDNVPEWCDWRAFRRLMPGEELHDKYMGQLESVYNPECADSMTFRNSCPLLTDALNCLVAVDMDYLYVSDIRKPNRHRMICSDKEEESFRYDPYYAKGEPKTNLLKIEISDEQPLYLIPRILRYDQKFLTINHGNENHTNYLIKLNEAVAETELGHQVSIYHIDESGRNTVLCFNKFSVVVKLSDLVDIYGAKRFTSREELLNPKI